MIGHLIGTVILYLLISFAVSTGFLITKELLSRRKAAAREQNTNKETEVEDSNKP